MSSSSHTLRAIILITSLAGLPTAVLAEPPDASAASQQNLSVTGQHRGYTNSELYLKLDNDKEMTFLVQIPGDKDQAWHKQFETLSRVTVTYHEAPGKGKPVATAIVKAADAGAH